MLKNKLFVLLPILGSISLVGCGGGNSSFNSVDENEVVELNIDIRQSETTYMVDDLFQKPTVIAVFANKRAKNVTKETEITGYDMSTPGIQKLSVKYMNFTSEYTISVCDNQFDFFSGKIAKFQGHTNKKKFKIVRTNGYLTTGNDFLTVTLQDEGVSRRYIRDNSFIVDTNGKASYIEDNGAIGDNSKYQTQIYDDGTSFYKITAYPSLEWENTYAKVAYTEEGVEINYDVGFANSNIVDYFSLF